ncbi:acyl-CoA N-acyltransferase [Trichoderma citrinoviride]|uniref:Acyl-CoA N-acyltransferase n=1 Tax=Trichoderma citrinoviride TaxID=58853 RepID=A0A2T4BHT4_9HYPO|nr:acyl-CoA N-acyltransferase [Trichoderma citrinoviride]PTB68809.1 acyl-CoA N-acyltransferase [Trichoderma citrinoviride]
MEHQRRVKSRDEIHTPRLILRAPHISDVPALHTLRIQHEVMKYSAKGADKTLEDTRRSLDVLLPPNDSKTYYFLIFQRDTGDLIGKGGLHSIPGRNLGWPEIGYSFRQETWGKGYGTEFLTAFVEKWWSLPRREAEIEVDTAGLDAQSLESEEPSAAVERLVAVIDVNNVGSRRILEKAGFKAFKEWTGPDPREAYKGQQATMAAFAILAPEQATRN